VSPGTHAAADGSFRRSAGIQVGRATIIVAIAVVIGVVLLNRSPSGGPGVVATSGATTSSTAASSSPVVTPVVTSPIGPGTTSTPLRAPQDIKVLVANGTTSSGLASRVSSILHGKGYNTLASTNSSLRPTGTIIYFSSGYGPEGAVLAQALGVPSSAAQAMPSPPPVASLNGANILVIAGPDLANATAATSTTKPAGTTSTSKP
jgi:hypothetical protein